MTQYDRLRMLDLHRLRLLHELHARGTIAAVADAPPVTPSAVSPPLPLLERAGGGPPPGRGRGGGPRAARGGGPPAARAPRRRGPRGPPPRSRVHRPAHGPSGAAPPPGRGA